MESTGTAAGGRESAEVTDSRSHQALTLPPAPPEDPRPGFPWLASSAPVVGALALWALTGSPFALAFAALGPIVALASTLDGRRHAAAARRRRRADREAALGELQREIDRRHAAERTLAWRQTPAVGSVLEHAAGAHWHRAKPGVLVIGRGDVPSELRIGGVPLEDGDRTVLRHAARLTEAPVVADARAGLGFVGPEPLVRAAARAALVQLAERATPGVVALRVPETAGWAWAKRLPHRTGTESVVLVEGATPDSAEPVGADGWHVATATLAEELPPGLGTVVRLEHPSRATVVREDGRPGERVIVPELLSLAEATAWATAAQAAAARAGLSGGLAPMPARVPIEDLMQPVIRRTDRSTLRVAVGRGTAGQVEVDLVRDGPHALVAGTSGSGKSEFLLAWLTALATVYPPESVAFVLIDFKGGASFEPLRGLPQATGLVTDLDEAEAVRAVESLRAELRYREEAIRDAGCRAIGELPADVVLPRLVIVVDEFQAMVERFPELAPLIGDIAARGRSLGVHLVLAAQRPNGVVREAVTANCGLRISLRVLHRDDSLAVLGAEQASMLDPGAPGRAVLAHGGRMIEFQSALASPDELDRVRRNEPNRTGAPARRPWLDPLPPHVSAETLAIEAAGSPPGDGELAFALADEPDRQRRAPGVWHPLRDGPFLVVGTTGSGRSTALGALSAAFAERHGSDAVLVLGGPPSAEWDRIHEVLERVRGGAAAPRLLVADDLDARYRSWPEEHRLAIFDAIAALCREGRAAGLHVAASALTALSLPGPVRETFGASVLLRHAARADLVQAGGLGALWRAEDSPGAGQWRGRRIQIVAAEPPKPLVAPPVPPLPFDDLPTAVVSAAVDLDAAALSAWAGREVVVLRHGSDAAGRVLAALHAPAGHASAGQGPVVVGDAEAWVANWTLLASMRERGVLVVHAGLPEFRSVSRDRVLPPMLDTGRTQCWRCVPGALPERYAWPTAPNGKEMELKLRNPQHSTGSSAESECDVPRN